MDNSMTPFEEVLECLSKGSNFVLQGGAGSGKTETLKNLLQYMNQNYSDKSVACITHTNRAADEIASRAGGDIKVSTIHSFLNSIFKEYKKDQHAVIHEIFQLKNFLRGVKNSTDAEYAKAEHYRYKKAYDKYAEKAYFILMINEPKCLGKREYDKDPVEANLHLNEKIRKLNDKIYEFVQSASHHKVHYNETAFDSLRDLSFGHDSLITMAHILFKKHRKLRRILASKFDCIFVDEYQDTSPEIVELFLDFVVPENRITFGFFGDSMQGIYESGIGDVNRYIEAGVLKKINKPDNFRCSDQVVKFINKLRNDDLEQEVAFKVVGSDVYESIEDRQGQVKLYYAVCDQKPHANSDAEIKEVYLSKLSSVIAKAQMEEGFKTLMLTNKAIAARAGFGALYEIFNNRYGLSTNENLEKVLGVLQFKELFDLCDFYKSKNYGEVISRVCRAGFRLDSLQDKEFLRSSLGRVVGLKSSGFESLKLSFNLNLIKMSDAHNGFLLRRERFLEALQNNSRYQEFKAYREAGATTFTKMSKAGFQIEENEFNELERDGRKERFFNQLCSSELSFDEIVNYYSYLDERTGFITMHKTKGTGISDVLVVADEFFWREYNFNKIFSYDVESLASKKIMYVACSRAIKNLTCVKMVMTDEIEGMKSFFDEMILVDV